MTETGIVNMTLIMTLDRMSDNVHITLYLRIP